MASVPRNTNPLAAWIAAALAAVVGLAALNWYASTSTIDTSPIQVASTSTNDRVAVPSTDMRPAKPLAENNNTETLKRPLFTPTRRPFDPAKNIAPDATPAAAPEKAIEPPTAPPAPLQVKLVGYTASPQRGKRALVRTPNERAGTWISIGDQVDGWRLRELSADRATFEFGSQRQVLQLETKSQTTERVPQLR